MRPPLKSWFLTILYATTCAVQASADEDFERGGAAIAGYDPAGYFTEMKPVKGIMVTFTPLHHSRGGLP
ncbi:MAG: hypothetical protein P0111_14080 [Nitrospira sp.]|nr:hypothetical protein [Nitrospira sp.]